MNTLILLAGAFASITAVAFSGCLYDEPEHYGPGHHVRISTYYDPDLTREEHRERAHELGFRYGTPAARGEPGVTINLEYPNSSQPEPTQEASNKDSYECDHKDRGEIVNLSFKTFCYPLDGLYGTTIFRVPKEPPVILSSISVGGRADTAKEDPRPRPGDCYYEAHPSPDELKPGLRIDEDVELSVPFGIQC